MADAHDVARAGRRAYVARINRVHDYIDAHLAEPLDLAELAAVAHFSPWHFHRVFLGITGETLADCVRRRRLEAAARRLLATPPQPALRIALDVGFGSAEVFTRAFKTHFGMTPGAWRRGGWRTWCDAHQAQLRKLSQGLRKSNQVVATLFDEDAWTRPDPATVQELQAMHVDIRTLAPQRVAYLRYTGPFAGDGVARTWQRFVAWFLSAGLMRKPRTRYGVTQDNPEITPPERCRYDCCIAVDDDVQPQGEIGVQTLAGGTYACAPFDGTAADIHGAWTRFYGQWLPASAWQAEDRAPLEIYPADAIPDPETGRFQCLLCLPVRPA